MAEESIGNVVNVESAVHKGSTFIRNMAVVPLQFNGAYENELVLMQGSGICTVPALSSSSNTPKVKQNIPSALQVQPLRQILAGDCHDVYETQTDNVFCNVCQVDCLNSFNFRQHLEGQKHRNKLQEVKFSGNNSDDANRLEWCELCRIKFMDRYNLMQHLRGPQHMAKLQERKSGRKHGMEIANGKYWCQLCSISCSTHYNLKLHIEGKRHASQLQAVETNKTAKKEKAVVKRERQNSEGRMNLETLHQQHWCELCKVWCANGYNFKLHLDGKKHASQSNAAEDVKRAKKEVPVMKLDLKNAERKSSEILDQQNWCGVCKIWCKNAYNFKLHLEGKRHAIQFQNLDSIGKNVHVPGVSRC